MINKLTAWEATKKLLNCNSMGGHCAGILVNLLINQTYDVISNLTPWEANKRPLHSNSMGGFCARILVFPIYFINSKAIHPFLSLIRLFEFVEYIYSVYLGERDEGWGHFFCNQCTDI